MIRLAGLLLVVAALIAPTGAAAKTRLPGFHSPSGNIKCFYVPGPTSVLRCQIRRAELREAADGLLRVAADRCRLGRVRADADPQGRSHLFRGRPLLPGTAGAGVREPAVRHHVATRCLPLRFTSHRASPAAIGPGHGLFISRASWRAW